MIYNSWLEPCYFPLHYTGNPLSGRTGQKSAISPCQKMFLIPKNPCFVVITLFFDVGSIGG